MDILADIQHQIDALPTRYFEKKAGRSRRGVQDLAKAVVLDVGRNMGLHVETEFQTRYLSEHGAERRGWIDVVIYGEQALDGLALAAEVVTDRPTIGDLLKLRDAPMLDDGLRLIIQLNPYIRYPIVRPMALTKSLSDEAWNRWSVKNNVIIVTETRSAIKGEVGVGHPDLWNCEYIMKRI